LGNVGAQIDADKIASDFRKRLQEAFAPLREVGETWEKETGEIRTAWEENMAPIMSWVKGFLGLPLEAKLGVLNHHFEQLTGIDLAATFEKAKKAILPALELIGEALAELRDWFVEEVWPPLKDAWNEFTRVLKSFGVEWSDVWKTAKSVLAAVLWAIMVAILGVIGIVAALAKAVAETVKFVVNRFKEFKKGMERTGEGIKALVSGLWKVVKGIFSLNLKLIWEGIKQAGEGIWKTVTGVLMQIWTIIKTIVGGIGTLVGHFVVGLVEFFINLKERLTGETQQTLDDLKRQWIVFRIKVQIVVRRLWTQIKMFFVNLRADVKRITGNLVDGVTGFFKGLKSDLVGTEGFVSTLIRKMSGLWGSFKDLLTGGEESLISKIVRGVVGGFNDLKDKIVGENGIIPNLIQDVEDFFTEKDWAQLGKDIINGLAGGVESVVGTLVDAVKGAVSEAFQGGKDEAQAESPSRLFAPLGADMVGGMRRGVLGAAHELERAVRDTVRGSFRAGGSLPSAGGGGRGPVTIYGGVSISEAGNANDILEQLYDLSGR
jgi:phage-related protein